MPNGFDLYGDYAGQAASNNGLDPSIFKGLIQTESSWNVNASPGTTSAYGLTQLTRGTAREVGANVYDPYSNIDGGAKYLGGLTKRFGTIGGLEHYYGSKDPAANRAYANKVLGNSQRYGWKNTAKNLLTGNESPLQAGLAAIGVHSKTLDSVTNAASSAFKSIIPGGSMLGGGSGGLSDLMGSTDENGCGTFDIVCKLQAWVGTSGFFKRLALALLAFIILLAAFMMLKPVQDAVKVAAIA
jgi:hypothetical protein